MPSRVSYHPRRRLLAASRDSSDGVKILDDLKITPTALLLSKAVWRTYLRPFSGANGDVGIHRKPTGITAGGTGARRRRC